MPNRIQRPKHPPEVLLDLLASALFLVPLSEPLEASDSSTATMPLVAEMIVPDHRWDRRSSACWRLKRIPTNRGAMREHHQKMLVPPSERPRSRRINGMSVDILRLVRFRLLSDVVKQVASQGVFPPSWLLVVGDDMVHGGEMAQLVVPTRLGHCSQAIGTRMMSEQWVCENQGIVVAESWLEADTERRLPDPPCLPRCPWAGRHAPTVAPTRERICATRDARRRSQGRSPSDGPRVPPRQLSELCRWDLPAQR